MNEWILNTSKYFWMNAFEYIMWLMYEYSYEFYRIPVITF